MYDEKMVNREEKVNIGKEAEKTEPARAAAMIHSRTRYRDYREGLLARPGDMTEAQAYQWKQQLLRCTGEPEEMRAGHQVRRAVICDGIYGVAGVAAYFRDIATGSFEDEGRRPAFGFVGLVWKNDSPFHPSGFPSMADFRLLVEKYVIPRWEEPKNGRDAEKATPSDYREQWTGWAGVQQADDDVLLGQALEQAVRGERVFFCTGLPEPAERSYMEETSEMTEMKGQQTKGQQASAPGLNRRFVTAGIICCMAIGILIWKILFA